MMDDDLRLKNLAQICELVEEQARIISEQAFIIDQITAENDELIKIKEADS